jgi:hypothetical protein
MLEYGHSEKKGNKMTIPQRAMLKVLSVLVISGFIGFAVFVGLEFLGAATFLIVFMLALLVFLCILAYRMEVDRLERLRKIKIEE